ncbi:MAG: HEAT repeat domain-containing protein [Anaerolineae bacterium]
MSATETQGRRERPELEETLRLLDSAGDGAISADVIYGLDSLTSDEIEALTPIWLSLDDDVRRRVVLALSEASETNFEFDFNPFGRFALNDPVPTVRALAVDLLWEDTSLDVMKALVALVHDDESAEVRASAASALGPFVLMGELGELDSAHAEHIQDLLLETYNNEREDIEVRRRALEAVANSGHEAVEDAILEAYHSDEHRMHVSALFAMGRTADDRWTPIVLEELESDDHELRYEAARAAGELELEDSIPVLTRIAFDDEVEIRDVAVWALGEIGGREPMRVLQVLSEEAKESDDEDLMNAIEDAIATANLGKDSSMYLIDFPDDPR